MEGSPFAPMMIKDGVDLTSVEGAAQVPYLIPNLQVDLHSPKHVVHVQWWRSVGHSHTAFIVETMIDELARLAGKDPVAYRLAILPDLTHYEIFMAPALAETVLPFLGGKSNAPSWANQVKGR